MVLQRSPAQNAVIHNRGGTLLVAAAAGSGKTSVLVDRLLSYILEDGKCIDEFLIITFTKAAAAELRIRIGRTLTEALREDPDNRHLQRQGVLLYHTQISTIHALCANLLREWGHTLDLPPDFMLCEEEDASLLLLQALHDVLEERYETIEADTPFALLLDLLSTGRDDSRLMDIALDVYGKMQSHADPLAWMEQQRTQLSLQGVQEAGETIWGRLLLDDSVQLIVYWSDTLTRLLTEIQEEPSLLPYAESLQETRNALLTFAAAAKQGWDAAADAAQIPFPRLKAVRNAQNPHLQEEIKLLRSQCKDAMDRLSARFAANSASLLEDLQLLYPAMEGLLDLVRDLSLRYARTKTRKNVLDFADLEHKTVALLIDAQSAPTEVAQQLSKRFAEIMVDEYQDTNQVQNSIFSALSKQEKNLFLVGDVKQSIYRFRLADPTIFLDKYKRFAPYDQAKFGEPRKILLSQNFRSRPEVLDAVNDVFFNIMSERLGEMNYTDQEALYPGGTFPAGSGYETELHVLNFEENTEDRGEKTPGRHALEARFVANRITKLLQEPFLVSDGAGGLRPLVPDDIVILLRSPGSVRHHYLQALREAQIPWAAEAESDFFESTEVSVLLSYLQIIDNPRQDIPLLSVLHSPLCALDGEDLARLRMAGEGDLYDALQAAALAGDAICGDFLDKLKNLRFEAVDRSCHELLWLLYDSTDALEIFARMPSGEARRENLLSLYELACRFEQAGHRGLFRFLYHIKRLQENGSSPKHGSGAESNGVKLLSIHRSKGLEYPVVFLCGLGRRFNFNDMQKPMLVHSALGLGPRGLDGERMLEFQTLPREAIALQLKRELLAEEMRLLYVAMTRAKEKLILTHSLSYGESDLTKLAPFVAAPLDPNVLATCICTGQWLLLIAMARPEGAVLRRMAEAEEPIGQRALGLPWKISYQGGMPAPTKGLVPHQAEERSMEPSPPTQAELLALLHWQYPHARLAKIPSKITATSLMEDSDQSTTDQSEEQLSPQSTFYRPRFAEKERGLSAAQKGTALHTAMQNIRLTHSSTLVEIREELYRLTAAAYLTQEEAESIQVEQMLCFFSSPIGQRMKGAAVSHREFPFSMLVPAAQYYADLPPEETLLFQGMIDCWFEDEEGITLLDFKTNRVTAQNAPSLAERYRPQMEAYTMALESMTGKPTAHKIFWFLTARCGIELNTAEDAKKV